MAAYGGLANNNVCLVVCVNLWPKTAVSRGEQNQSLRLAAAYTTYGAADKILRWLTADGVYGGLCWLTAVARGSNRTFSSPTAILVQIRPKPDLDGFRNSNPAGDRFG